MEVAKVTSKGQITIPISIRRKLEINEGDKVLFIYKPEGVMMVNPNTMQGGDAGDIVEAAETEMAAEAVAAMKKRELKTPTAPAPVAAVEPDAPTEPVAPVELVASADTVPGAVVAEAAPTRSLRVSINRNSAPVPVVSEAAPTPPPEETAKPDTQVDNLDLSTLLDDIRSIGSNI